jgi:hypothetical protein
MTIITTAPDASSRANNSRRSAFIGAKSAGVASPRSDVGDGSRHRQHRRHGRLHDAGHHRRADTTGIAVLAVIAVGHAPGHPLGAADQEGPQQRLRPARLLPPRVRRLRRLSRRLVLLDPVQGRESGHRRVMGLLRGRSVQLAHHTHRRARAQERVRGFGRLMPRSIPGAVELRFPPRKGPSSLLAKGPPGLLGWF